jgi:DNA-directed RNA polymerase specialized sigma subunit
MKTPKNLITYLLQHGSSQQCIAKSIGISQMTVSRLYRGLSSKIDVVAYTKLVKEYEEKKGTKK